MRDRHDSPLAGAPHARFSSSLLLNPRPPPPGPCPRPSVCRGQPMALRHGATGRRPRASPVHGRGRRPLRERGGRSRRGVGGRLPRLPPPIRGREGPGAALHDGVAGRQGPARRRERARATWRGRRALQAPGPDARFPARVKGRRRGARKRSAPCRTRRRRGRRRGPCVRDRRAGRGVPARLPRPGRGQAPSQLGVLSSET